MRVKPDGVEQHAPDIVLPLVPGVVAYPHRTRAFVAAEVIERDLVQPAAPVDAVHDLQVPVLDPVGDEVEEVGRLAVEAEGAEGPEHERRVAQPAVAVVPVALAAGRLGQRGRRRGDHRSGRRIGQGLERERGPLQVDLPWMIGKAAAVDPLVPVGPRYRKPRLGVIIGRRRRAVAPSEGAERLLAGAQSSLGARLAALKPEPQIGAQPQRRLNPLRLADGVAVTVAYVPPASIAAAVVERRLAVELEIDEAVEAAEGA